MTTILITGTTSGIGRELCRQFAETGCRLVLISRDKEKLNRQKRELAPQCDKITVIPVDLTEARAAKRIIERLRKEDISVDILVNNAGFNEFGWFTETDFNKEMDMLHLHIRFTTEIIKLLLPGMLEKGQGKILNVGSTGSFIPTPKDAVYAATKAYILHFSNALSVELAGSGISVTTLCPGSTRTNFAARANMEYTLLFRLFVMKPGRVAAAGIRALEKGRRICVPGLYNKMLVLASKLVPYPILSRLTVRML